MRLALLATALLLVSGCENETQPEVHPQSANDAVVFEVSGGTPAPAPTSADPRRERAARASFAPPQTRPTPVANGDPSRVLILPTKDLNRPSEIVGFIDMHVPMGSHDTALDQLRRRAAEMGADAVIDVDFNHAEVPGEPNHLSGTAVRYVEPIATSNAP